MLENAAIAGASFCRKDGGRGRVGKFLNERGCELGTIARYWQISKVIFNLPTSCDEKAG
jgi:hypothetical protein